MLQKTFLLHNNLVRLGWMSLGKFFNNFFTGPNFGDVFDGKESFGGIVWCIKLGNVVLLYGLKPQPKFN